MAGLEKVEQCAGGEIEDAEKWVAMVRYGGCSKGVPR